MRAGKQQRSYFRNEAIKQIQNEHNPPINQHMAMSFACLWITNLWGEFLQMEFSMPCTLCFKHSKQTNKSNAGPELLWLPSPLHPPPHSLCQVTDGWLTVAVPAVNVHSCKKKKKKHRWRVLWWEKRKKQGDKKNKQTKKLNMTSSSVELSFCFWVVITKAIHHGHSISIHAADWGHDKWMWE